MATSADSCQCMQTKSQNKPAHHVYNNIPIFRRGTSAGPPQMVAKVGSPQLIASTTVSPNASYSAGCTNAPRLSTQHPMKPAAQPVPQAVRRCKMQ